MTQGLRSQAFWTLLSSLGKTLELANFSSAEAAKIALRQLEVLRDAGIQVGASDARSVVWGSVLALITDEGFSNADRIQSQAEELAAEFVMGGEPRFLASTPR